MSYAHNADGIRTAKVVDGVEHRYVTRGGKLMRASFGSGDTEVIMDFSYNESGNPLLPAIPRTAARASAPTSTPRIYRATW